MTLEFLGRGWCDYVGAHFYMCPTYIVCRIAEKKSVQQVKEKKQERKGRENSFFTHTSLRIFFDRRSI